MWRNGRRSGLKIRRPRGHEGSIPSTPTATLHIACAASSGVRRVGAVTRRRGERHLRAPRRMVVLAVLGTAIGLVRKQRLDAADAAFPEAMQRV